MTDDNTLHALKPFSGELIWSYRARETLSEKLLIGADYTVYLFSKSRKLIALTPGGTVRWKRQLKSNLSQMPAASPEGALVASLDGGELIKLNGRGQIQWEKDGPKSNWGPVIDRDGFIYIAGSDATIYSLAPTGNLLWQLPLDSQAARISLWQNHLIVATEDRAIYSIDRKGGLSWHLSDLPAGRVVSMVSSEKSLQLIYARGRILSFTKEGKIEYEEKGPPTSGYAAKDNEGALYLYGTNKKLYKYFEGTIGEITSETEMSPPRVGTAGN